MKLIDHVLVNLSLLDRRISIIYHILYARNFGDTIIKDNNNRYICRAVIPLRSPERFTMRSCDIHENGKMTSEIVHTLKDKMQF